MGKLTAAEKKKVQKPLLWIGMASIVMTFAGLTSGYVVSRSALIEDNRWLEFALPPQFAYATAAILLSTLTMIMAVSMAKKSMTKQSAVYVLASLLLGIAFLVLQWEGAKDLMDRGLFFTGGNSASSWVYVIAALHWAHVLSGIIVLFYTWLRARKGAYTKEDYQGLTVSAIYWHFLDGLWLYLYLFLLIIR